MKIVRNETNLEKLHNSSVLNTTSYYSSNYTKLIKMFSLNVIIPHNGCYKGTTRSYLPGIY